MRLLEEECVDCQLLSVRLGCCNQCSTDVVRRRVFSGLRRRRTRVALLAGRRREICDAASVCAAGAGCGEVGCVTLACGMFGCGTLRRGTAVDILCTVRRLVACSHWRHDFARCGHWNAILAWRYFLRHSANRRPTTRNDRSIHVSRSTLSVRAREDSAAIPRFALFAIERKSRSQRLRRSNCLCGTGDAGMVARVTILDAATMSAIKASVGAFVGAGVGAGVGEPKLEDAAISFRPRAAGGCGRT